MESEVQGYLTEFGILKEQILKAIQNLNDEAINWCPLPKETNSIYAILCHLIGSENYWVRQIISGETVDRDRESEFRASGHILEIAKHWEDAVEANEQILKGLNSSQLGETRTVSNRPEWGSITVRWCILHLISHYAVHLGHIQLTRQLWEQR